MIALGETTVATGVGAQGRLRIAGVLVAVLLAMAFVSALWWVYFGGEAGSRCARGLARLLRLPGGPPLLAGGCLALVDGVVGHLVNGLAELVSPRSS